MVSAGLNAVGITAGTGNAGSACRVLGAASAFCSDSQSFALFASGASAGVLVFWLVLAREAACSGLAISFSASAAIVAVAPAAWPSILLAGDAFLLGAIVIAVGRAVLSGTENWNVGRAVVRLSFNL